MTDVDRCFRGFACAGTDGHASMHARPSPRAYAEFHSFICHLSSRKPKSAKTKTEIHPLCILLQYGLTKTKINPFSWHLHGKCQKGLTKTSINPLLLMRMSLTSHGWRSRLKILEQAQIFSACHTITLRASHQPQGDKPKINTMSIEVAITSLRLVREPIERREVEADY